MISVCTTQIPGTLASGGDSESVTSWAGLNGQVTMAEDWSRWDKDQTECIWKILRQVDESFVPLWIFCIIPGSRFTRFINNYIRHLGWLIKLRIHIDVCGLSKISRVRISSSSLMRSQLDNLDTSVLHFMNKGSCSGEVIKYSPWLSGKGHFILWSCCQNDLWRHMDSNDSGHVQSMEGKYYLMSTGLLPRTSFFLDLGRTRLDQIPKLGSLCQARVSVFLRR